MHQFFAIRLGVFRLRWWRCVNCRSRVLAEVDALRLEGRPCLGVER